MIRSFSLLACLIVLSLAAIPASAQVKLGDLVKGGGIALVVSKFGKDINKAINALTKTPDDSPEFATNVVPVISAGDGKQVGAVQIMGPRSAVDKVQAVAQIEGKFGPLGIRVRALVPIATKSITDIRRVPGVGISGLIDVKL